MVGQDSGLLEKQPWALPIKTLEKHHLVSMGGIQSVAAWLSTVPYSQPCGTAGLSWGGGSGICSISGEAPAALSRGGAQTTPGFLLSRDILGTRGGAATLCPNAWAGLGLSEAVALGAALCFSAPWGAAPLCGGLCFIFRLSLISAQRESLCSYGDRGIWGTLQHGGGGAQPTHVPSSTCSPPALSSYLPCLGFAVTLGRAPAGCAACRRGEGHRCRDSAALLAGSFFPT